MWPCLTTGIRPTASATATIDFTRGETILLENSGAKMNSGETRARTRKKAATCCSEKFARIWSGAIGPAADRLELDGLGDADPEIVGPVDDRAEHPRPGDDDHRDERDDLGDEGEGLLLDLRDGLEDRDGKAHDEAGQEHRERDLHGHAHHLHDEADDFVLGHDMWKLWTREPQIRFQPSTRMKRRILNGREMKTGGSIIMPIDISVEDTTRSMIRNGRKIRKPIWKAVLSSEMMKAGMRTVVGTSRRVSTFLTLPSLTNSARSFSRVWLNMNSRSGASARLSATSWVIVPFCSGS